MRVRCASLWWTNAFPSRFFLSRHARHALVPAGLHRAFPEAQQPAVTPTNPSGLTDPCILFCCWGLLWLRSGSKTSWLGLRNEWWPQTPVSLGESHVPPLRPRLGGGWVHFGICIRVALPLRYVNPLCISAWRQRVPLPVWMRDYGPWPNTDNWLTVMVNGLWLVALGLQVSGACIMTQTT